MAWAGTACLGAHLLGLGWLAPLVTALVAASDDEHVVSLSVGSHGSRVVLAHDSTRPGMAPGHEHCVVAALLVAMATELPGGHDHVLSFPSGVSGAGVWMQVLRERHAGSSFGVVPEAILRPAASPCPAILVASAPKEHAMGRSPGDLRGLNLRC